jgi:hypothetical protein
MPDYNIPRSNPSLPDIVLREVIGNTNDTSLSLVGRNDPNYVPKIAENFLHMLENFSNTTSPNNPITGQIWYDSSSTHYKLKVFDGIHWNQINSVYKTVTGVTTNFEVGDIFVDTTTNQIKIYTGTAWTIPANVDLTSSSITGQPEKTTATSNAYLVISDGGILQSITKSNFLADTVTPYLVQTGMITLWSMDYTPTGWLMCDGTLYPRTTYNNLFAVIGTRYGYTDSTNFKVPNLAGPVTTGTVVTTKYIIKY